VLGANSSICDMSFGGRGASAHWLSHLMAGVEWLSPRSPGQRSGFEEFMNIIRSLYAQTLFFVALSLCGCRTSSLILPAGTYRQAGANNYIKIIGRERMAIYYERAPYPFSEPRERECFYGLSRNGEIYLTLPGRSAEFIYGIGRLHLLWNGKDIEVADPKMGDSGVYSRTE
jgi:hypothetical protein